MEYAKSSPYLLSFMDKYKLKEKLVKAYVENPWNSNMQKQRLLLKTNDIYKYNDIPLCNAKLSKLSNILFDEKGEKHGEQLFLDSQRLTLITRYQPTTCLPRTMTFPRCWSFLHGKWYHV